MPHAASACQQEAWAVLDKADALGAPGLVPLESAVLHCAEGLKDLLQVCLLQHQRSQPSAVGLEEELRVQHSAGMGSQNPLSRSPAGAARLSSKTEQPTLL